MRQEGAQLIGSQSTSPHLPEGGRTLWNAFAAAGSNHMASGAPAVCKRHSSRSAAPPYPDLKIRVVNVVDLMTLQPHEEHPHGITVHDFDALFTTNKPVIFAHHGYPWLIHRLTYRRTNHHNIHVRGYKEEGTTTTPFDMAVRNNLDRFHLVSDVIDRVPKLGYLAAYAKQEMRDKLIEHKQYITRYGDDSRRSSSGAGPSRPAFSVQHRLSKRTLMLVIPLETLAFFIIVRAREFDAEVPVEPDAATGSDGPDDDEREVLLDTPDNPTEQELRDAIDGLGDPERQELLALMWLGRGDYDADSWPEVLREAAESTIASVTDYLVGTPLLGDYLEEGASALGLSLEDFERG